MQTQPRTLEQLHRRPTSYEVVARTQHGDVRLGFTERKTKSALLSIAQANGQKIIDMLGDWDGEAKYNKLTGWVFGPVAVLFSGNTERDFTTHLKRKQKHKETDR